MLTAEIVRIYIRMGMTEGPVDHMTQSLQNLPDQASDVLRHVCAPDTGRVSDPVHVDLLQPSYEALFLIRSYVFRV